MLGLFKKSKSTLIAGFFNAPEHRWVWENKAIRVRLVELFLKMETRDLHTLIRKRRLLLMYSDARMSCAFYQFRGREVVLVFPDLYDLLLSPNHKNGQAILAHEFGHIVLGHASQAITNDQAQSEADAFAASLGYGEELALALEPYTAEQEIPTRIRALRRSA